VNSLKLPALKDKAEVRKLYEEVATMFPEGYMPHSKISSKVAMTKAERKRKLRAAEAKARAHEAEAQLRAGGTVTTAADAMQGTPTKTRHVVDISSDDDAMHLEDDNDRRGGDGRDAAVTVRGPGRPSDSAASFLGAELSNSMSLSEAPASATSSPRKRALTKTPSLLTRRPSTTLMTPVSPAAATTTAGSSGVSLSLPAAPALTAFRASPLPPFPPPLPPHHPPVQPSQRS